MKFRFLYLGEVIYQRIPKTAPTWYHVGAVFGVIRTLKEQQKIKTIFLDRYNRNLFPEYFAQKISIPFFKKNVILYIC